MTAPRRGAAPAAPLRVVRLVDENGRRGGTDQRRCVEVWLRAGAPVNVEGVEANPRAIIDRVAVRVAARAARTVSRRMSRARTLGLCV